jgi:hypothetical protein
VPFVWNPGSGGGGGGGTVHTDGVTIQGDGSAGNPVALLDAITDGVSLTGAGISANKLALLDAMSDGLTLTGAGIVSSKLTVAPSSFFTSGRAQGSFGPGANVLLLMGFDLPGPLTFSTITIVVQDTDNVGLYDVGVYNAAGTLVAHAGAQTIPAGSVQNFSVVGGAKTVPQGAYMFAFTGAGNVTFYYDPSMLVWCLQTNYGSSSGGVLPSTITPPTRAVAAGQFAFTLS